MRQVNQEFSLRRTARVALLAALFLGIMPFLHAQTSEQFWPEVDANWRFTPKVQLEMMTSRSTDGVNTSSAELGPTLKIAIKPFLRKQVNTPDPSTNKLLVLAAGYRYLTGVGHPDENRAQLSLTPQFPLRWSLWLADRNQIDLRVVQGTGFSWRYRNRVTLERSFKVRGVGFTPYARGEVFYSSVPGGWNKNTYSFGVYVPLPRNLQVEPYYEHDNNLNATPKHVNAVGVTFYVFLHNKPAD